MNTARTGTSVVADRIRIEDEVWEEAFATRVPSRRRRATRDQSRATRPRLIESADEARFPEPADEARFLESADEANALEARVPFGVDPMARSQGRAAERNLPAARPYSSAASRRRHHSPLDDYSGFRPDRLAMWAMLLGVALMAVAILSSGL